MSQRFHTARTMFSNETFLMDADNQDATVAVFTGTDHEADAANVAELLNAQADTVVVATPMPECVHARQYVHQ